MTHIDLPTLSGLLDLFESVGGAEEFGPEGSIILLALWRKSRKLGWLKTFTMTNTELHFQSGIKSRATINSYRNKLVEADMIGYITPPNGQSKGTYTLIFGFKPAQEPVQNMNSFAEPVQKAVQELNSFSPKTPEPVQGLNSFTTTVLKDFKDFKDLASTSATENIKIELSEIEIKRRANEVEKYFLTKAQIMDISSADYEELVTAIKDCIPVEIFIQGIDQMFYKHKPKHRFDKIKTIKYCLPLCYDIWVSITENVPSEPVALGSSVTQSRPLSGEGRSRTSSNSRNRNQEQIDILDKIIGEEEDHEQS